MGRILKFVFKTESLETNWERKDLMIHRIGHGKCKVRKRGRKKNLDALAHVVNNAGFSRKLADAWFYSRR